MVSSVSSSHATCFQLRKEEFLHVNSTRKALAKTAWLSLDHVLTCEPITGPRGNGLPGTGFIPIPAVEERPGWSGPPELQGLGPSQERGPPLQKHGGRSGWEETIDVHYMSYVGFTHFPFHFQFCIQSY